LFGAPSPPNGGPIRLLAVTGSHRLSAGGRSQFIKDDTVTWEETPMLKLAEQGELMAFPHGGFWQPMDTLREKNLLEKLWSSDKAPWKVWT